MHRMQFAQKSSPGCIGIPLGIVPYFYRLATTMDHLVKNIHHNGNGCQPHRWSDSGPGRERSVKARMQSYNSSDLLTRLKKRGSQIRECMPTVIAVAVALFNSCTCHAPNILDEPKVVWMLLRWNMSQMLEAYPAREDAILDMRGSLVSSPSNPPFMKNWYCAPPSHS